MPGARTRMGNTVRRKWRTFCRSQPCNWNHKRTGDGDQKSDYKSISEDSVMWASRKQTRNIRHRIVDWSPFETTYLLNNKVNMNIFLIICLYCCWIELDMVQRFTLLLTRQIWRMSELLCGHQLFNWHPSYTQQYLQFLHLQVCKQKYI